MKKYQISSILSLACILGIIFQNYRLAAKYNRSTGKTRALFGITELAQLDIHIYLGLLSIVSLLIGIFALLKKENQKLSALAIALSGISIILLFIRLWTFMV